MQPLALPCADLSSPHQHKSLAVARPQHLRGCAIKCTFLLGINKLLHPSGELLRALSAAPRGRTAALEPHSPLSPRREHWLVGKLQNKHRGEQLLGCSPARQQSHLKPKSQFVALSLETPQGSVELGESAGEWLRTPNEEGG